MVAILTGLLTFVLTPMIAIAVAATTLFFRAGSGGANPAAMIAELLGLRDIGGFLAAQAVLVSGIALLGDLATGVHSWRLNRSGTMAVISFVSAVMFQLAALVVLLPAAIGISRKTMQAGIESERSYQQYARMGDVRFDLGEQYSELEMDNLRPEYGPLFKRLWILVPVSVSRPGFYQINVQYSFSAQGESGSTPMKEVAAYLDAGDHTLRVEYLAHEIGSYGFWSPSSVGGIAEVQLSYLASEEDLLGNAASDPAMSGRALEQFLKDEGLDKRQARTAPTIAKFVERREVQF